MAAWQANTTSFHLSLARVFRNATEASAAAAKEWTLTRIWLNLTVVPPAEVIADDSLLRRIAEAYYEIEEASLDAEFRLVAGGKSYQQHYEHEVSSQVQKMRARWTSLRAVVQAEGRTLESQLRAILKIEDGDMSRGQDEEEEAVLHAARTHGHWWQKLARPSPRSSTQNGLVRQRSAETKRFLWYLRKTWYPSARRSDAQRRSDGLGSVFSGKVPTSALEPGVTHVDHCVPQAWMSNTQLLQEFSLVAEDMSNVLVVPARENLQKSMKAIRFASDDPLDARRVSHSWFSPDTDYFSEQRQASCIARIYYMFLSYPMISQGSNPEASLQDQGAGSSVYANVHAHMTRRELLDRTFCARQRELCVSRVLEEQPAVRHDRFLNLLSLFLFRSYNPFLQEHRLLQTHPRGDLLRQLLTDRLSGSTRFPGLCSAEVSRSVALFPS